MADRGDVVVYIDDELVSLIHQKLQVIDDEPEEIASLAIFRVVPRVREIDSGAYDPKLVSIGPFHKKNEVLQPMERLKRRFLLNQLRHSPENSPKKYIQRLRSLEARARLCYSEQVVLDSNAFVEMMLLDACFIIEFLLEWFKADENIDILRQLNCNPSLLRNDLLLLENQIPFFALKSVYLIMEEDGIPSDLRDLALYCLNPARLGDLRDTSDVHHLLHLFHKSLCPTIIRRSDTFQGTHSAKRAIKNIKYLVSFALYWLLSLFLYCRMPLPGEETSRARIRIPSATQLQDAGVVFKKKKASSFIDITFINGTMKIPQLSIEPATIPRFRNLIAFEHCCPTAGSHFTAYTVLMDNLIDTPEDVALLVSCDILDCQLDSNQEVAGFFNSLDNGASLKYGNHYLVELFRDVNNYRASEIHRYRAIQRWRAMLTHDYFSKPWVIISPLAAFLLLILTIVQTYFAVLAYYHPPS